MKAKGMKKGGKMYAKGGPAKRGKKKIVPTKAPRKKMTMKEASIRSNYERQNEGQRHEKRRQDEV